MSKPLTLLKLGLLLILANTAWAAGRGQLAITVVDRQTGKPIACRMHLKNAAGKPRRAKRAPFWHDHFVFPGKILLDLPVGNYTFDLERGPEYVTRSGHFRIDNFADDTKQIDLARFVDMAADGWYSGDLYIRRRARDIPLLMEADDLHVGQVIGWWDGKTEPLPKEPLVRFDENRFYHLMAGGHHTPGTTLLYFNLPKPLTEADRPLMEHVLKARENADVWIDASAPFWWDLPMLVAHGQIDSIQVAHAHLCRETVIGNEADGKPRDRRRYPGVWGNSQWSQEIYFKLLDCGLRIPPSAGSGSGVSPNPVGYNRMYVHVDGEFDYAAWWKNFRAGRVVVTNGPLIRPTVNGQLPGHVFAVEKGQELELEIGLTLSTRKPISYLELIKNGRVEHSIRFDDYAKSGKLPKLTFQESGWFLIRAVTDLPKTYRFAMTGPYYVEVDYQRRISRQAAGFFLDWVYERAKQIKASDSQQGRKELAHHRKARDFWQDLVDRANAD